jgi:predicted negative regulator of RcsB-dependent stress response
MAKPMKKEELRRPDAFVQWIDSSAQWMKKHTRLLWIFLALVIASSVTVWIVIKNQNMENKLAATAYYELMQKAPASAESNSTQDWAQFLPEVQAFVEKHGSADLAAPALMLLAKAHYATGDFKSAQATYQRALDELDADYHYLAKEGIALSLQAQDQMDQSIELLETLANNTDNPLQEMHMWYLALAYQAKGDQDQALKTLQAFEQTFPTSVLKEKVQTEIALLEPSL